MYRVHNGTTEVLLVHPGGPLWAGKDEGVWSIPKGEFTDEDPLDAAKREFQEETGFAASGEFLPLDPIKQTGGKHVFAWAVEGDCDVGAVKSNSFRMEWPPHSGQWKAFPEVDRAAWFSLPQAGERIFKSQRPLLDQLEQRLKL